MGEQATRQASHPRKLLDDIIQASGTTTASRNPQDAALEQWYEEERVETGAVAQVLLRIYTYGSSGGSGSGRGSGGAGGASSRGQVMAAEVAEALVKYCSWSDYASSLPVSDLYNQLCSLSSFRSLQKRLQVRVFSIVCW